MKASELRIGNYVNVIDQRDTLIVVESIGINYINLDYVSGIATYGGNFQNPETFGTVVPILLTEEWLVKFGFEKYEDNKENYYYIQIANNLNLTFDMDPKVKPDWCGIALEWRGIGTQIWGNVQYVHQLQNLYFALTGEELELKK